METSHELLRHLGWRQGGGAKGQKKEEAESRYLELLPHAELTVSGGLGFHFNNHCDIHV